jgi:isoquinoline 1-oxidoreductase beta subunit
MPATRREALRGLVLLAVAPGLAACSALPVLPARPDPAEAEGAAGWVGLTSEGRVVLHAPRQEMGQGVLGVLRRIVAAELGINPGAVEARLLDTAAMPPVRATVGSESLQLFAEPLARAAAALRGELERRAAARLGVTPAALRRTPDGFGAGGATLRLAELAGGAPVVLFAAAVREARPLGAALPPAGGPAPELAAVLRGAPVFAADILPEGLLHGAMLRPPRLGARLAAARPGAAAAVPGFVAFAEGDGWAGVVAERPGALARAVAGAKARWEGGSEWGAADLARATDVDARLAARGGASLPHRLLDAAVERGGPWDLDLRLDVPMAAHAAIEPRAATARWSADRTRVGVWTGTQDAFFVRAVLARRLGLREAEVVVRSCRMGGAFGGRTVPNVEIEAARLARAVAPRPVLVQWTRADEFREAFHRPPSSHRIRARLGPDGRVAAWWHAFSGHVIFTAAVLPPWLQRAANAVTGDTGIARGARPMPSAPRAWSSTRCRCRCRPARGAASARHRMPSPWRARWTNWRGWPGATRWPSGWITSGRSRALPPACAAPPRWRAGAARCHPAARSGSAARPTRTPPGRRWWWRSRRMRAAASWSMACGARRTAGGSPMRTGCARRPRATWSGRSARR